MLVQMQISLPFPFTSPECEALDAKHRQFFSSAKVFVTETITKRAVMIHELRFGEMTAFEERPQSPCYGAADVTPFFLILLDEFERWIRIMACRVD